MQNKWGLKKYSQVVITQYKKRWPGKICEIMNNGRIARKIWQKYEIKDKSWAKEIKNIGLKIYQTKAILD